MKQDALINGLIRQQAEVIQRLASDADFILQLFLNVKITVKTVAKRWENLSNDRHHIITHHRVLVPGD